MREIKFRGKCKNKWVYGFLTSENFAKSTIDGKTLNVHTYAINSYEEQQGPFISGDTVFVKPTMYHYVDKETIGQYTSLKDKNGIEIYEGDIVASCGRKDLPCVVEYNQDRCEFVMRYDSDGIIHILKEFQNSYEVIGNIHDNPELLEVEE